MLLTLAANSLHSRLVPKKSKGSPADAIAITDLPKLARETLGLFGLHLTTPVLAGADAARLDAIRDAADKSQCPCLTLSEPDPQPMFTDSDDQGDAAINRIQRVVRAASRLGCSSVGLSLSGDGAGDGVDFCIERLRQILSIAERLEINLLISPMPGFTADPDRLTDLIKRVGGFRVGTFPDFITASKQPDPALYLRRIVPYAAAVNVSCKAFKQGSAKRVAGFNTPTHDAFDLTEYLRTVAAVGYTGTLAIDYQGDGDLIAGILSAKSVLDAVLGPQVPDEGEFDDDLLDEIAAEAAELGDEDDDEDAAPATPVKP